MFALSLAKTDKRDGRHAMVEATEERSQDFPNTPIEGMHRVQILCKPSCLGRTMCLCKSATNHKHSNHHHLSTVQKEEPPLASRRLFELQCCDDVRLMWEICKCGISGDNKKSNISAMHAPSKSF